MAIVACGELVETEMTGESSPELSWRDHKWAAQAQYYEMCFVGPGARQDRMNDRTERKRYWRDTKWQMLATLGPYLMAVVLVPLYAEALNTKRVLGMPLGYFAVCHGLLVVAAVVIASFVNRQDAIDHWYGANEDP
jgi:putative solute:sodium symporter small subunit